MRLDAAALTMTPHGDAGKVGQRGLVSGDDGPPSCLRGRRDHEVVCSPRPALASNGGEKLRMCLCDPQVVVDDRNSCEDVLHEVLATNTRHATR